jgi:hypothetical protein
MMNPIVIVNRAFTRPVLFVLFILIFGSCSNHHDKKLSSKSKEECKDECCNKTGSRKELSCRLMTAELQDRKNTVLASLKKQVLERKELKNGYAFKFNGDDKTIDELTDFIKTERHCCDFFTFNLAISGDTSSVWMEITGVPEVKEFIQTELEL